jgi:phosphatidylserine/phosphatidylglycerophosphate/cardiolipin synthase-like enzyme
MTEADPVGEEEPAASVWRYGLASRAHGVVDGAAYFELVREAMMNARQRIMLIGWDFDTRIRLGRGRHWWKPGREGPPARLGSFVLWLARTRPELEIRVLKWNFGVLKSILARGSMIVDLFRWWRQDGIEFKLDSAHPLGCSHHQKIVVIDDRFAVCGGIDLTGNRWDTRDHLTHDPRRRRPTGRHYGPWHDLTMMLEGEPAALLGAYGRERWCQAGGRELAPCRPQAESPWPQRLRAEFREVEVGIARTRSQYGGAGEVREIDSLFLEHIARARRFIYAENQYFASRRIAEAIALRLSEPDPPEIVLVGPLDAHGWLEQPAMDTARVRLLRALRERDHARRFGVWTPVAADGTPIYVHAKLLIVDDEVVRVGSANMNNRSLGLDSECDVFIDCARPANRDCGARITGLRHSLLAEHCGLRYEEVGRLLAQHGSMAAMIDSRPAGGRHLRRLPLRELTEAEKGLADMEALDPERPEEMLLFYKRGGLFRRSILRRPR